MSTGFGRYTQIDLGDLRFLEEDHHRGGLNREAARFALELAGFSYDFQVDRWLEAGWTDISIQADEKLLGGVAAPELANRPLYQRVVNEWIPLAARRHISSSHLIRQAKGRIWKPDEKTHQTGKAVAMIHPLAGGRFVVAIGFMGTGKRPVDWTSNFRFDHPEGFHQGFLTLTKQFEENADRITFEQTASQLGLDELSLADILQEAKREDSRFTLFGAGHSQGAAILQLWMYRQIAAGLQPRHVLGYGFAPPSVAAASRGGLRDYPLYHFSNSDDIITRVGLYHHIGRNYVYKANDAFRSFCYQGWNTDALFNDLLHISRRFGGTQDVMRFMIAYVDSLQNMPREDARDARSVFVGGGLKERMLLNKEEPVDGLLRMLRRMMHRSYETAMGIGHNDELVRALSETLREAALEAGTENYTRTMLQVMSVPHRLVFRDTDIPGLAPYSFMVIRGFGEMREDL
jgi:hypothetical protein